MENTTFSCGVIDSPIAINHLGYSKIQCLYMGHIVKRNNRPNTSLRRPQQ